MAETRKEVSKKEVEGAADTERGRGKKTRCAPCVSFARLFVGGAGVSVCVSSQYQGYGGVRRGDIDRHAKTQRHKRGRLLVLFIRSNSN